MIVFDLCVNNTEAARKYYSEVFSLVCADEVNPNQYILENKSVRFIIRKCPKQSNSQVMRIHVVSITETKARATDNGAVEGQTLASIIDPFGITWELIEKRQYAESDPYYQLYRKYKDLYLSLDSQ